MPSHTASQFDSAFIAKAKVFLEQKRPRTDMERVLCLAYCLSSFRGEAEFTGMEVSRLNSDIGLPQLTNPSFVVRKAVSHGLLGVTPDNSRRLTEAGTKAVELLPTD